MTLKQYVDSWLVTSLIMSPNEETTSAPLLLPTLTASSKVSRFDKLKETLREHETKAFNWMCVRCWLNYTVEMLSHFFSSTMEIS